MTLFCSCSLSTLVFQFKSFQMSIIWSIKKSTQYTQSLYHGEVLCFEASTPLRQAGRGFCKGKYFGQKFQLLPHLKQFLSFFYTNTSENLFDLLESARSREFFSIFCTKLCNWIYRWRDAKNNAKKVGIDNSWTFSLFSEISSLYTFYPYFSLFALIEFLTCFFKLNLFLPERRVVVILAKSFSLGYLLFM